MEDCYKEIDKVVDRILEALDGVRYSVAIEALDKSRISLDDNAIVHKKEKDIVIVKTIGNLISSRRIEMGLTQKDVADHCGVSEGTVSRWESGDIDNMRRDRIAALAQILDVSPLLLLENDKSKRRRVPYEEEG